MDERKLQESLCGIAAELFRFQRVFEKVVQKLEVEERSKYMSQFAWFSKRVTKALEDSNLRIIDVSGQLYDPGMAVTPLNIDEFDIEDQLFIEQTIEPIIMQGDSIYKTGTVILGRVTQ